MSKTLSSTQLQNSSYLLTRLEALERQTQLLKAAIKETWSFIPYHLPISLEIGVQEQASLKAVSYSEAEFKRLRQWILDASIEIMQQTDMPFHYTTAVQRVKQQHREELMEFWTEKELGDKASLDGKVRDLRCMGYLTRVGKGTYFYGEKLAELRKKEEKQT